MVKTAILIASLFASLPALEVTIAPYLGDRPAAYSFTFDDCWKQQAGEIASVITPLELTGTFFLIPWFMDKHPETSITWAEATRLAELGNELGTHASVRPKLHEIEEAEQRAIINGGHDLILEHCGVDPISWATPGGSKLDDALRAIVAERHPYTRGRHLGDDVSIKSYGVKEGLWDFAPEQAAIEETIADGGWRIGLIHGITDSWRPIGSVEHFRAFCTWIHDQQDRLWIAPMGVVASYREARSLVAITSEQSGERACRISMRLPEDAPPHLTAVVLTLRLPIASDTLTVSNAAGDPVPATRTNAGWLVTIPVQGDIIHCRW